MRAGRFLVIVMAIGSVGLLAACGDDDDSAAETVSQGDAEPSTQADIADTASQSDADTAADAEADTNADTAAAEGGKAGTLTLGDEVIAFDSARCYLKEQDAAAGGGKILFVGQGYGSNAAGDQVVLDVTRYNEESQFAGDDVTVDIGQPGSSDAYSYRSASAIGTVTVSGSVMTANDLTFRHSEDRSEATGSFELRC